MPSESIPRVLLVEVRGPDFTRLGQVDARDIADLTLIVRLNNLGGWSLTLPSTAPAAELLRTPGAGLVATLDGEVLLSGPLVKGSLRQRVGEVDGWSFEGVDDNWVLADRLAWPSPESADVAVQVGNSGYDGRSGPAESVLKGYVTANVGPSAPAGRRVDVLDVEPDLRRGATVTGSARFHALGELLQPLATVAGLAYRVRADGERLLFEVSEARDLRGTVRFDVDNETADEADYSFEAPGLTRAIVAGQGEAEQRLLVERTSADSLAAEALWGRRREQFIDRRDVSDQENGPTAVQQLEQAGDEALTDKGFTLTGLTVSPVDTPTARFWADWRVGDRVTATVGDVTFEDVVSETTVTFGPNGLGVKAVLGDPDVASRQPILTVLAEQRQIVSRLNRLERR